MPVDYIPPVDKTATQHDGTESLAINNTIFRRVCTLLALNTTGRFYPYNGGCKPISKHVIVKSGYWAHLTEAATMKYIAEHTSIPVPKIYCSFVYNKRAYMVMERIQGDTVAAIWFQLSEESRSRILEDLKRIILELRRIKPAPGTGVQSCVGGSLRDCRMPRSCPRFGPFKTIKEFHLWLREYLLPSEILDKPDNTRSSDVSMMVAHQDREYPHPIFTHGDLHPQNILVRDDKIVGIIDWEFSGWYPNYWEYTSAWMGNRIREGWQEVLPRFLETFPEELEMERIRHQWWGEY
ncbi:Protein kinase-like (PK-like) [Glarea lozoyensis ATCC 20868]|uniref:Protein kinase-like (PK-like) n=1 Tax=Glarea lozoyensis (strain ATCC 20868 / MF5171) TaxID=1116229 RepID=S3D7G4_GLAL2|nr:Protein kinase-like (PK-like) [Glarea lozoyensis ATCC 20868]EPE33705.1 Protein kinase-like (PK-like) [Glarea lozoyensis ATCC 20868]